MGMMPRSATATLGPRAVTQGVKAAGGLLGQAYDDFLPGDLDYDVRRDDLRHCFAPPKAGCWGK